MSLPLAERVFLAQALWQSIESGMADTTEQDAINDAIRRDYELTSGAVIGRTHDEVPCSPPQADGRVGFVR